MYEMNIWYIHPPMDAVTIGTILVNNNTSATIGYRFAAPFNQSDEDAQLFLTLLLGAPIDLSPIEKQPEKAIKAIHEYADEKGVSNPSHHLYLIRLEKTLQKGGYI